MKCYKDKGIIIFDFDDGKRATFDMNTGETIGKMGKPVKSLSAALAGYSIDEVLNSFTDKKYKEFLYYVHDNFTPHAYRRNGYNWTNESRVKNLGTLLKYANEYKTFEQYFRADVKASYRMRTPLSEVPKGLLKLCRQTGKQIEEHLITYYKKAPDVYNFLFSIESEVIDNNAKWAIAEYLIPGGYWSSSKLLYEHKYNIRALFNYIEYLCTFEGLNPGGNLVREIGDYANMMHQISEKYEKYPRYFLSTHRIASRNYERLKREFSEQIFQKHIKPEYEITHGDYKFFYPKCTQDIKDEAVQQHNCVASYIDNVIEGKCHILFLRKKDAPNKSVVTIEVRNGEIVQAFQAYNQPCNEEQRAAIAVFNKKFSSERKLK